MKWDIPVILGIIPLFFISYLLCWFVFKCIPFKRFIPVLIIFFLSVAGAKAGSLAEVLSAAERLNLASNPTWLKLLHYERGGKKSEVLTEDFFLSQEGRIDPNAELTATIEAYFSWLGEDADGHARCRFPARYFWLSQHLPLPEYHLREPGCKQFEKWALLDDVKTISVFLVSGYFGNPASTFGHALIKLNTDSVDDQTGLFDLTLNYGALVPENENTAVYVARGLFGGYLSGFSDKYFYTHDLVYSRTEFRDIWDYKLELTDYERTLLILHIWEISGKKFTYYFLDKNCAYRLAELLDLVIAEELLGDVRLWYVPVELFHRLKDLDELRVETGSKLIRSVRFIPSSQRVLYRQLEQLTPDEVSAFDTVIFGNIDSISTNLEGFTVDRQIKLLDALLAYQKYRLIAEEPNHDPAIRQMKDRILLARLHLPVRTTSPPVILDLPSPADGTRPIVIGSSVVVETNEDPFLRLHFSPYKQELVGQNSLEENELVVFDLTVGFYDGEKKAFVDRFDLVRIKKLNSAAVAVGDENQWSWQLRIGTARVEDDGRRRQDGVASFGAGRAWKLGKTITGYGLVDLSGHTLSYRFRIRPHLGVIFGSDTVRTWLYLGVETDGYDGEFYDVWGGQLQYRFSDRYALHIEVSNEKKTRASIGLNWYW